MSEPNSFVEESEPRDVPSPPQLGGGVLPIVGGNVVDEDNGMDGDAPHHHHPGQIIITHHSHLDGEPEDDEDDDDSSLEDGGPVKKHKSDDKPPGKVKKKTGGSGRRRIEIKFIENKSRRQVTFSRRKRGLMKKAYELTTLTGTQALVLIASETGHVYTFATPKLQPVVTLREGKELIQSCLNAPDNNYPPSDYLPNNNNSNQNIANQNVGNGGNNSPQSVHQSPKPEPVHSPAPLQHQQHLQHQHQHAQHQQHMSAHAQHQQLPPQRLSCKRRVRSDT